MSLFFFNTHQQHGAASHHSRFCRTRRTTSEGGLRTTIHNIMDVATDNAYLTNVSAHFGTVQDLLPGEDVLRVVVAEVHLHRLTDRNTTILAVIRGKEIWLWKEGR